MVGVIAAWVSLSYSRMVAMMTSAAFSEVSLRVLDWKRLEASLCRLDVTHSSHLPNSSPSKT